jgi:hypothetical protein
VADKTITELGAVGTLATSDEMAVWDVSLGGSDRTRKTTVSEVLALAAMNINGLPGVTLNNSDKLPLYSAAFSSNRHVTGSDLYNFASKVEINGLSSATPLSTDTMVFYDVSATANAKATLSALGAAMVTAGSWTPVLTFGGGSTGITYGTQLGQYLKLGPLLLYSCNIILTSKGSSTGVAQIGGLPVAAAPGAQWRATSFVNISAGDIEMATVVAETSYITLAKRTVSSGAGAAMTNADVTNTSNLLITGFYQAAS